ncbi:MAG: IS21 family transposase [Chloroflexota bacterium]
MDIRELLRHIQSTTSDREVARMTGAHRRTVRRYRRWAETQGLLGGSLPELGRLRALVEQTFTAAAPPQTVSSVEPYRALVVRLYQEGVEGTAIWQRVREQGFTGHLSAVYRFLATLGKAHPEAVVRVEREPGEEAQVDFGSAGQLMDSVTGEPRKAWVFVMTLSWSRHQYAEFVFDQRVPTWLGLHGRAFAFFGGVPQRVVIDNLKAGITRAAWDDPEVQTAYRECAEHYRFLIAPCRPRTPEHKGKVEQGGVHYLCRNFLGGRTPTSLGQANQEVRVWCLGTAGERVHGTTKAPPLARFLTTEQARLQALPAAPYDLASWRTAKVHRDCYVVFEGSFYSAPFRLIGQSVRVRGGCAEVRLYSQDLALVANHPRAAGPGERHTHPDHLPPTKLPGLLRTRAASQDQAARVGPATAAVAHRLLADPVLDRLPTVGRLLRLGETYGPSRLEAACARAVRFDDLRYATIKRILVEEWDREPPAPPVAPVTARTFVRTASDLLGHLFGGASWT